MSETVVRTLRTAMQISAAEAVIQLLVAFGVPISQEQHTALLGFISVLATLAMNALEAGAGTQVVATQTPDPPLIQGK